MDMENVEANQEEQEAVSLLSKYTLFLWKHLYLFEKLGPYDFQLVKIRARGKERFWLSRGILLD